MRNIFKVMIWGYLLPLLAAGIVVFIPAYDGRYIKWIVLIFIILLGMPIILRMRFSKNKEKAYKITITYQLYVFVFFFTFPLLKVLKENIFFQLLLIGFFVGIYFLARFDQRSKTPIVFPGSGKKLKKIAYVYYAMAILLTVLAFGGDYIVIKRAFIIYGAEIMMPYTAIILYLFSCWLMFFFSSLAYKSHVKDRYLEK